MTTILHEKHSQMIKNDSCKSSSTFRCVRMLPNRGDRCVVTTELHSSSLHSAPGMPVQEPIIFFEVIARPAVLSHKKPGVTTSLSRHTVDSNATCCHTDKAQALQSPSDSHVLAKTRRPALRMDRLITELVNGYAKPHNNTCLFSGSRMMSCKNNSISTLLRDEIVYHQSKCQPVTEDKGKTDSRENQRVSEHDNISGSLTHVSASALDYHGNWGHSSVKTSMCGRLVRGGHNHSRNKCQTKPADSEFLGRIQSIEDKEFVENLRKASIRLRKARSGCHSRRVTRQRRTATSGTKVCSDGMIVVGQSFITNRNYNLQAKDVSVWQATGRDCYNEVNGISLLSEPLAYVHRPQGIVSDVSGKSDHNAAAGALSVTNSNKEDVHVTTAQCPSCLDLIHDWSAGKISI